MKIDFHTHAKLTKRIPYSQEYTKSNFRDAKLYGLDAICVTEHYDSSQVDLVYKYIHDNLEKEGDSYLFEGLRIFCGIEIDIAEGGHIVAIGTLNEISDLYNDFHEQGKRKNHPTFEQLLSVIKRPFLLIGAAHPFRMEDDCLLQLNDEQIRQLDYIELSGKDIAFDKEHIEIQTRALAGRAGLPIVMGSDTHQSFQYGCVYNQFKEEHTTVASLKRAVAEGAYTIVHSEFGAKQVWMASKMKKALINIYNLNGDYVSIVGCK